LVGSEVVAVAGAVAGAVCEMTHTTTAGEAVVILLLMMMAVVIPPAEEVVAKAVEVEVKMSHPRRMALRLQRLEMALLLPEMALLLLIR